MSNANLLVAASDSTSYDILVIILSLALAVFLIVSTIFAIYLILVMKRLNHMTYQAESFMENLKSASSAIRKAGIPIMIARIISFAISGLKSKKRSKERR